MSVPLFVGAGAGAERLTAGSFTVSKTGCTAGNLMVLHMYVLGTTADWGGSGPTNIEALDGTDDESTTLRSGGEFLIACGRVMTSGTCDWGVTVGASGEDIAARLYEFSGAASGSAIGNVFQNVGGLSDLTDALADTGTVVGDAPVVTNGSDRLALAFVALDSAQAIGPFTGETGGDWTEAVAEYVGSTLTLQLQIASMPSPATIDNGSVTVGSSTPWLTITSAIIPSTAVTMNYAVNI